MNNDYRIFIYAFLSRVMSDIPDTRFVKDLRENETLQELIGTETKNWFAHENDAAILDALNSDFTSMYILNTQPVESFVLDAKNETLVGLQNPVMAFYYHHGFELDMNQTAIMAPDHLSIEFAFMQTLIYRNESAPQRAFMDEHLMQWVLPYMMGMKAMASTPFYRELCDFIIEFLVADYETIAEETGDDA